MAIDTSVLKRDAQANIADWPATIRHHAREITVHCNAGSDISDVLEGGLLDDMSITLVAISDDFGGDLPQPRDLLELQLKDGSWQEFEIQRVPDLYDPNSPTIQLVIGNPAK
jgi:hypothetical protein